LIEVRGTFVSVVGFGDGSSSDQVYVKVIGDDDEDELVTPTTTDDIEVVEGCTYTALVNLNCRIGPGSYYISVGFFLPGQSAPVVGKTADDFYWYVIAPDTGNVCTVPNNTEFGTVEGDCSEQPRFTPVPLPTATPTPESACTVYVLGAVGGVVECVSPCPEDADPGEVCIMP
jgi:hypothetical protein